MAWGRSVNWGKRMLFSKGRAYYIVRIKHFLLTSYKETNTMANSTVFKTHQIDHPDGKLGKDGKLLRPTVYTAPDGTEYSSSDILTVGSGKTAERYIKADLTDAEKKSLKTNKGTLALRKLADIISDFDKRVQNAVKNGGIITSEEDREVLANYSIGKVNGAVNALRNVKTDKASDNPF